MRPQNVVTAAGTGALILAASASASEVTFKPTTLKAPFIEQFVEDLGPDSRWTVSQATKQTPVGDETFSYVGTWAVEEPEVFPGIKGDKGLVLKSKAAHHAISTVFEKPIETKGKPLVVQYEVKLQKGLECGGAYLKLLSEQGEKEGLRAGEEYTDKTPFTVMFGPDRCGSTNKVHFIFRHKNPVTGVFEEKHYNSPPLPKITKTTALYTLIINPDNTFSIKINDEEVSTGNLLEDFTPAVNPDAEIDDPEDFKPADWVDIAEIDDVEAVKPDDWDEDAPLTIVDVEAVKPEDWLDDEPIEIADPEAEKPEEWDDEEDGDWVAPTVPNPKCQEASGCGDWQPPKIRNPDFKGKWVRPKIANPEYKGVWAPAKIPNPDFFEDKNPAALTPIGGLGFELWTMTEDILFDNIYIGHDVAQAEEFAKETFYVKRPIEQEAEGSAPEEDDSIPTTVVDKIRLRLLEFVALAQIDPLDAAKQLPEVAAGIVAAFFTFLALLGGLFGLFKSGGSAAKKPTVVKKSTVKAAPAPEAKIEEIKEDDSAAKKRTTRSSKE
ncbi:Calnexin [Vanrija pseudolonga]|uniref:Calnexin n=1 Tax=Vanrija pseudolonga TaxID=143232 RepID=A0AAF0Y2A9_9TREE|nr:Calnexin [Vanrija pseudolonga]